MAWERPKEGLSASDAFQKEEPPGETEAEEAPCASKRKRGKRRRGEAIPEQDDPLLSAMTEGDPAKSVKQEGDEYSPMMPSKVDVTSPPTDSALRWTEFGEDDAASHASAWQGHLSR